MMDAPRLVWAVSLVLALLLTGVAVLLLLRVLRVAADIKALAQRTLPAAKGIAAHTDNIRHLPGAATPLGVIAQASRDIESATGQVLRTAVAILNATPKAKS